jgi:hypothetical protein
MNAVCKCTTGEWQEAEYIINKLKTIDLNEVNSNLAWAFCVVQQRFHICTEAILKILPEYKISKSSFYRAKHKLKSGGVPGEGKRTIISPSQWKNVEDIISSDFEKGKKTKASQVSSLVCFLLLSYLLRFNKNMIKILIRLQK